MLETELRGELLLRRSFSACRWPAPVQVGTGLGYSSLAADDRGSPPVLARIWHASLHRALWLLDRFCRSPWWSEAAVRLRSWEQERCQVRVDGCKSLSVYGHAHGSGGRRRSRTRPASSSTLRRPRSTAGPQRPAPLDNGSDGRQVSPAGRVLRQGVPTHVPPNVPPVYA